MGIDVEIADTRAGLPEGEFFGVVFQSPGASGLVRDLSEPIAHAKERGMLVTVAADLS